MNRRLSGLAVALAVAVFAAACSDAPSTAPQVDGPSFANAPSPNACIFSGNPSLSNAANAYFKVSDDQKAASTLISAMDAGFAASGFNGAKDKGFDLLSLIGKVSRAGTGSSPADGAAAVRYTIQCMFDVEADNDDSTETFFGWPTNNQFDFATALSATAGGGALYVRGGPADSLTYPVIARGTAGNISGIAPAGAATWPSTLLNNRALIYGEPITGGYDWKLIPRATSFSPSAVVALCQAAQPAGFDDDEMVHQGTVGVLGFVGAQAATICGQTPSQALRGGPLGSFALLGRLVRFADRLLAPQPLYASAVLRTSTIGGSASGAKGDPFTSLNLPEVNLTFSSPGVPPAANVKVNTRFSLEVNVSTPDGEPAGGITVSLSAQTNNGTATGIFQVLPSAPATFVCDPSKPYIKPGAPSATTLGTVGIGGVSQPTNAKWSNNLCFSKTGSVYVFGTSAADGHPAAGIGGAKSNKVNVKP